MELLVLRLGAKLRPQLLLNLGTRPWEVRFTLTHVEVDGAVVPVMAAMVSDEELLRELRLQPSGFRILEPGRVLDAGAAVAPPAAPVSSVPPPGGGSDMEPPDHARRHGWAYADMTGAGDRNQWGAEGGFGEQSGLTMAEMALTPPPPDWERLRESRWPWECPGWRPPGIGWKPQLRPAKKPPEEVEPNADAAGDLPVADEPPETVPDELPQEKPQTRDEEVLAGLERREDIEAFLRNAQVKGPITANKAKALLGRNQLPLPNPEQLNRLLTLTVP